MEDLPSADPLEDISTLSFESAFLLLEETTQTLESGNLTLDDTAQLYEKGMKLAHHCNQLISDIQLHISQLKDTYDSEISSSSGNEESID